MPGDVGGQRSMNRCSREAGEVCTAAVVGAGEVCLVIWGGRRDVPSDVEGQGGMPRCCRGTGEWVSETFLGGKQVKT